MKKRGFKRKSQSTIEYMMTYGWALLIVIIALSIMWALGVFSPKKQTSTTDLGAPIRIDDVLVNINGITVSAKINPAFTGQITDIKINSQSCTALGAVLTNPLLTEISSSTTCTKAGMFVRGNTVVGQIVVVYSKLDGGVSHSTTGTFSGQVEPT